MKIRLKKETNCLCFHNGFVFHLSFSEFVKFVEDDDDDDDDDDDCEF